MSRPQNLHDSLPSLWRHLCMRFGRCIRRQRPLVVGSLVMLLISVGLKLLEPWPLKWVFDHVLKSKNVGNRRLFDDFFATLDSMTLLGVAVGSLLLVTARALAEYLSSVGFAHRWQSSAHGGSQRPLPATTAALAGVSFEGPRRRPHGPCRRRRQHAQRRGGHGDAATRRQCPDPHWHGAY